MEKISMSTDLCPVRIAEPGLGLPMPNAVPLHANNALDSGVSRANREGSNVSLKT